MVSDSLYHFDAAGDSPDGSDDLLGATYRIGDLAREFNVTLRALRFYEDKGLIAPKRIGTTRLYHDVDRTRLKLILFAKKVGFSLMEIREILQSYDAADRRTNPLVPLRPLFEEKLDALKAQRAEVEQVIDELSSQLEASDGIFSG